MKVPISWLKEYVAVNLPLADIANRLTLAGNEVGEIRVIGGNWANIVIGQITAINPHPNADRLRLATVDLSGEQQTVVCGAPNLQLGDKVAFARVGAQLIDGHTGQLAQLKPAKIRDVASSGMVCSEKELGISDNHEGILVLPPEAPLGTSLADYMGETIFDLEVTPNRPDCLSVTGIAREVAALTGENIRLPDTNIKEAGAEINQQISINIIDSDLCPRYCASLITGVKIAEAPRWMQQRLLACGMRPINNIVDITNYVMLEYGQPLHAFDYNKIGGKKIIVRRANRNEQITSLDGEDRALSPDMLVIADENRAVAIAGVMGGADSEVTPQTTSILLEAASFNPANIHYTARTLRLTSEASMRFERGVSRELTLPALKRATQLIVALAGGKVTEGIADVYPDKLVRQPITLSTIQANKLLGTDFSPDQMVNALTSLGFDCQPAVNPAEIGVTPPYWRSDINLTVDLIEEVARIIGYDKIPTTMLSQPLPRQNPAPIINLKKKVAYSLTGYGFREIITYSLTSLELLNKLLSESSSITPAPHRMANPISVEQEYLRPNLRANLLANLSANQRHEDGGIRLFELGKIYLPVADDLPDEIEMVCGVMSGPAVARSWQNNDTLLDFFDAKGVVASLLDGLGLAPRFAPSTDETLHPNKQASISVNGQEIGVIGELHPKVALDFELAYPAFLFELNLNSLVTFTTGHSRFQPIPRFPAVVRDIAIIIDYTTTNQQIEDIIKGQTLVKQAVLFDIYSGGQVPTGKKSLAYRITYQSPQHTLTDEEVNKAQQQILNKLSKQLGATLRS